MLPTLPPGEYSKRSLAYCTTAVCKLGEGGKKRIHRFQSRDTNSSRSVVAAVSRFTDPLLRTATIRRSSRYTFLPGAPTEIAHANCKALMKPRDLLETLEGFLACISANYLN